MKANIELDALGISGLFLTAIFSPCCFPLYAFIASALGSFELFGGWTMWVFQAMVVISLIGFYWSYRQHRCTYPLLIAVSSAVSIFYGYYFNDSTYWYWQYFFYVGMFGLLAATLVNYYRNRLHSSCETCAMYNGKTVELESILTCPHCGHSKVEMMPTDACQFFYECEKCKAILKPKPSDCCVYCSYGTTKCLPIQAGETCC